jgi:protein-tyrosine-phosphatase
MAGKIKVCFVCTENIGRSLAAEHCLKVYLKKHENNDIEVTSAGTTHTDSDLSGHHFSHFEELKKLGADVSHHQRRALTKEIMDETDIVVAMAESHQKWIKETFNREIPLFSQLIDGTKRSIIIPHSDSPDCSSHLRQMVKYFYAVMPIFVVNIYKYKQKNKELIFYYRTLFKKRYINNRF